MHSYMYIFSILIIGFFIYFFVKDKIFDSPNTMHNTSESFNLSVPAPASIEIRQAPLYPPRTITPSGSNPPNQQAQQNETVMYGEPVPTDPYNESHESSDIPEVLRFPERSFRPSPQNNNTHIASESGIAGNNLQTNSDNSQKYSTDFIEAGGEFMPGIFANDTYSPTNFSAF